jgi:hypothetical protein
MRPPPPSVRLEAVDDRGSTVSKRAKFVIFMYRAPNAAAMAKAKGGRHMGQLEQTFHGHHIMFQVVVLVLVAMVVSSISRVVAKDEHHSCARLEAGDMIAQDGFSVYSLPFVYF